MIQPTSTPLYRFRITAKHLRYSMEVFAAAFGPEFRSELYPCFEEVQAGLGDIHDHAAALERFQAWLAEWEEGPETEALRISRSRAGKSGPHTAEFHPLVDPQARRRIADASTNASQPGHCESGSGARREVGVVFRSNPGHPLLWLHIQR